MISIKKCENCFTVSQNGKIIGEIFLYENDFHKQNCYLKFDFFIDDEADCKMIFAKIRNIIEKPLQVMTSSDKTENIKMLVSGGFELKRKCFEIEAEKVDYIGKIVESDLKYAVFGDEKYNICCQLMYEHYLETHNDINPWTAGFLAFRAELPETVCFDENESGIENLAFIEENEIAYVCGNCDTFISFAEKLVSALFEKYKTVCFESDDCDSVAMKLKSLFIINNKPSYDTYVYG